MLDKISFEPNVISKICNKCLHFCQDSVNQHYLTASTWSDWLTVSGSCSLSFHYQGRKSPLRKHHIKQFTKLLSVKWRRTRVFLDQISASVFAPPVMMSGVTQRFLGCDPWVIMLRLTGSQLIIVGSFQIFPEAFSRHLLESFATSTSRDILWTLLALMAAGGAVISYCQAEDFIAITGGLTWGWRDITT